MDRVGVEEMCKRCMDYSITKPMNILLVFVTSSLLKFIFYNS